MACMTNTVKRRYWFMVLATVFVLTWLSKSAKTMVKMIVAGSSVSQHALRDARVNRQLRADFQMTEKIDRDDEERVADLDSSIQHLNAALKNANALEARMPEVGKNMDILLKSEEFRNWAENIDFVNQKDFGKAAVDKISRLMTRFNEKAVIRMLEDGKKVEATKSIAEGLEMGLALKRTSDGDPDKAIELLVAVAGKDGVPNFLGSPFLKYWIDYCEKTMKNPYSLLTEYFLQEFGDRKLAHTLAEAKGSDAARNVATELEKQLIEKWVDSSMDVFRDLKFDKAGIDTPEWDTWVSYLVKKYVGEKIGDEEENELVISVLRKYFKNDDRLRKWIAKAKGGKRDELVTALESTLEKMVRPTTAEELEAGTTKFDEKMEGLLEESAYSKTWAKYVEQKSQTEHDPAVGAKIDKISTLIANYGEEKVIEMLATNKNVPAMRSFAESLELGLALKWTLDGRMNDVKALLAAGNNDVTTFWGSHLLKDWIYYCEIRMKKDPYSLLLTALLLEKSDDAALAKQLAVAKDSVAAKNVAAKMEEHLMAKWLRDGVGGDTVFEKLELKKAGFDMINQPEWDTWVSYLEKIGGTRKYSLVFSELKRQNIDVKKLLKAAHTYKGRDRAIAFIAWLERQKAAQELTKSNRMAEENDGKALHTMKRQRNDDGQ
ncbi:unnamed protein product [Peronospora farinosa]|uniref:RxLR effector protein n=1 Tax=Peronospora farinosa TaxID=134698 RepID=A0AAV0STD6_9STRA|nr:unnamed protein product [Peronospora farinosa]CAI5707783.1 unnamed protein product [Peronospora farinosa]